MKMKALPLLITMLLLVGSALAQTPPIPAPVTVFFTIDEERFDLIDITVTPQYGTSFTKTTEKGVIQFDMSDTGVDFGLWFTSELKFSFWHNGKGYTFTDTFDSSFNPKDNTFYFDITTGETVSFVCWDGKVVTDEALCLPQPEPEPQPDPDVVIICADGSKVAKEEDCPKEEPEEPVEDEGIFFSLVELLGLLLVALGVGWRAGYLGLVKYYWKKGEKGRAIKMLFTATKRAKDDYYKNK